MLESRSERRTVKINVQTAQNVVSESEALLSECEASQSKQTRCAAQSLAMSKKAISIWKRKGPTPKGLAWQIEARAKARAAKSLAKHARSKLTESQNKLGAAREFLEVISVHAGGVGGIGIAGGQIEEIVPAWNGPRRLLRKTARTRATGATGSTHGRTVQQMNDTPDHPPESRLTVTLADVIKDLTPERRTGT